MSIAAWPTPRCAMSARPWRGSLKAAGWSPSPGRACAPDNPAWTRCVRPLAGARPCGVLRRDRWRGLRQARHDHRHAPDRDRQAARRRSDAHSRRRSGWRRTLPHCSAGCTRVCPAAAADRWRAVAAAVGRPVMPRTLSRAVAPCVRPRRRDVEPEAVELAYETVDWTPAEGGAHHRGAL